jgi:hypothetical protein
MIDRQFGVWCRFQFGVQVQRATRILSRKRSDGLVTGDSPAVVKP